MSYYAKVVGDKVVNVIVAEPEFFDTFVDDSYGTWLKTSFNVRGGVYYDPTTGQPHPDQEAIIKAEDGRQRKNFASLTGSYNAKLDAFIGEKFFASWVLDEETCLWKPPVPQPEGNHWWDEETLTWKPVLPSDKG